jgi:hypothetical protein
LNEFATGTISLVDGILGLDPATDAANKLGTALVTDPTSGEGAANNATIVSPPLSDASTVKSLVTGAYGIGQGIIDILDAANQLNH